MPKNILTILDQLRAISIEGLTYANDKYDIERYKKLMELTTQECSELLNFLKDKIINELVKEIGCITPKLDIDVTIINTEKSF